MTQKRSERLQLVVDLAMKAETQAAKNLGQAQNIVESERHRLDEINQYYKNYEDTFARQTKGLRPQDLVQTREFLANLNRAAEQQSQQLRNAQDNAERARDLWRKSHLKADSLEDFQMKCASEEESHVEKKEQQILDDMAAQKTRQVH